MAGLPSFVGEWIEAAERLGGGGVDMVADRLELAVLELREAKIRLVQVLLLACLGTALLIVGLVLAILAALYVLPPEWRPRALAIMAGLGILGALAAFLALRRRLTTRNMAFAQSLAELRKDKACF